jgi:hypothetical protein
VCLTPGTAPRFAAEDPLVGPWIARARADAHLGDSVLWHDSVDFGGDRRRRVQAMLGMAEKPLRRVLIHGYLEPAPSHKHAAIDLSLSRAAYFRRLRAAVERVAEYLAER